MALVDYYGTAEAALSDSCSPEPRWAALLRDKSALRQAREVALREVDFCHTHDIRILPVTSKDYPFLLQASEVADRPLQLFYKGNAPLNRKHILSVVGTRRITEYGKVVISQILEDLGRLLPDVLVVSGLAYGVDIHAHKAALSSGLDTVAVLAHGHDRIYPALHKPVAAEMEQQGGLLTEYFTGTNPDKGNFVRRNRIVAGMSMATLVVESAQQGGSLITATLASSYGREVMAVPGRVTDPCSAGCNQLIRQNKATLVTSAQDLLDTLGWQSVGQAEPAIPQLFPVFTVEQEAVLNAFEGIDPMPLDALSRKTGMSVVKLSDLLFDLEDMQAVKRLPGNRFRLEGSMCKS